MPEKMQYATLLKILKAANPSLIDPYVLPRNWRMDGLLG